MNKTRMIFLFSLCMVGIVGCSNGSDPTVETYSEVQTEYDTLGKTSENASTYDSVSNENNIFTDTSGNELSVSIVSVSATGISYVIQNNSTNTVRYGEYRDLYVKNGAEWESVEYRELEDNVEIATNDVLYNLDGGETVERNESFETVYSQLPSGHYKLSLNEFYYVYKDPFVVEIEFDVE